MSAALTPTAHTATSIRARKANAEAASRRPQFQPAGPRFVSYLRVSTARQGASGLGLEAQREAVAEHIRRVAPNATDGRPMREYVEVESGKENDRPQLQAALRHAKLSGATLIIAKLDWAAQSVIRVRGRLR